MATPNITMAVLDMDSIAYVGACIAEKNAYIYKEINGDGKSQEFPKAAEGKVWFEGAVEFGEIVATEWKRHTIIKLQDVSVALKGVEFELSNWKRDAIRLTKNPDLSWKGYLTPSGLKTKDIAGLEDRYQFNRYMCKDEWIKAPAPTHLKACREHLLSIASFCKMAPPGFEADAPVVAIAEKAGPSAVAMSKDKDIAQLMRAHFIDMNPSQPKLELHTVLGHLEMIKKRSSNQVKGSGFKLICYQTIVGDTSDGYKGLNKAGPVFGFKLLADCTSIEECLEALLTLYRTRFPEGHKYVDWGGVEQERTPEELLAQHMQLAYHERGRLDKSNPIKRYLAGEDPIVGGYRD